MAKKKFKIRAKLVFSGYFMVQANNKQEAEAAVKKDCGCLLGSVQSLNENVDWEFDTHGNIVLNKNKEQEGV
ncbi:hypothetical protein [Bacteroides sp.]|uniref:hypothetical protein n=1 Tax=Bacteroides sp. TaxID=29523 RepID=UPI002A7F339B|nr:hypothetical protein [Bacteroides sp.]